MQHLYADELAKVGKLMKVFADEELRPHVDREGRAESRMQEEGG